MHRRTVIGLVGLRTGNCDWAVGIPELPIAPTKEWLGFVKRCEDQEAFRESLVWTAQVRLHRPDLTVGLVPPVRTRIDHSAITAVGVTRVDDEAASVYGIASADLLSTFYGPRGS